MGNSRKCCANDEEEGAGSADQDHGNRREGGNTVGLRLLLLLVKFQAKSRRQNWNWK